MATIIYDAEVFPYNWMFGFKILETGEIIQIWDDHDEIREFVRKHKKDFWISYNGKRYDDIILDTVEKGIHPYDISCRMIDQKEKIYSRSRRFRLDIAEGMAVGTSLKSLQSEFGMSIEETQVDFHLDRPLTEEEKELTNYYNASDLNSTEVLLNHRWSNFVKTKMDLIKYFNLKPNMMNKPLATMVATGLGAKRTTHPPRHFQWYPELQINNPTVKNFIINETFLTENLVFDLNGVEHTMGLGGIHGARDNYHSKKFWKVDVKGYYSLIQMERDLLSRSLPPEGKQKYKDLYFERLDRKKAKDPSADSLKAGVLAVWGATLNQHQLLADITTGQLIMITGQAFMVDLAEKLEPYSTLVQTNTDGIFIEPFEGHEEDCRNAIDEWVARTGFEVEYDYGTKLYQKDVNNYCCLFNGEELYNVEAKGSYVNMWRMQDDPKTFEFKLTYNQSQGTVVDKALIYHFLFDVPVEETINKEMNPKSFQYTLKKGAKSYSHVELHETNNYTDETKITQLGKINRVFACNDLNTETRIYKIKNGKPNKFPRMDINVFVFNKALDEWSDAEWEKLDRQYYIDQAHKKILDFTAVREKKVRKTKNPEVKFKLFQERLEKDIEGNKIKIPEFDTETLYEYIKTEEDGIIRLGDCTVNKIGDWLTFVEKNGKTTILNIDKFTSETLKPTIGFLRKQKIKIDNKTYFEIFERTLDTIVCYVDKREPDESFTFEVLTFEDALQALKDYGLVEVEILEKFEEKSEQQKNKKKTTKTRENIILDEFNLITYRGKDRGEGIVFEIFWMQKGEQFKHERTTESDEVMPIVTKWIEEYEMNKV